MRNVAIILVILLSGCATRSPSGERVTDVPASHDYILAVLLAGGRANEMDETAVSEASIGHRAHIESMAAEGTLLLAAPFGDPRATESWRGLYVFDLSDVDEAYELAREDPSIVAGLFDLELMPWRSDVDLRPLRTEIERGKAAGAPFVPAAYVLALGESGKHVDEVLHHLEEKDQLICAGELGGEHEGQILLLLTAETVEEARSWLGSDSSQVRWDLSSLWATELLGALAVGR